MAWSPPDSSARFLLTFGMPEVDWSGATVAWLERQQRRLLAQPIVGYEASASPAAEPVACAALAACAWDLPAAAVAACRYLYTARQGDGSVAVRLNQQGPYWPTSLACLAWRSLERQWPDQAGQWCRDAYRQGLEFLVGFGGEKIAPSDTVGHNTQLVGWPWVRGTHSWLEPTALALLALRHCGQAEHPRAHEAAALILDRLLPSGGANYGNTSVLGQVLRPHVLPSAMCMVALQRLQAPSPRWLATLEYLRHELTRPMAATSLAWTLQAVVAAEPYYPPGQPTDLQSPFQAAIERLDAQPENPHRANLLLIAGRLRESPLLALPPFELGPFTDEAR